MRAGYIWRRLIFDRKQFYRLTSPLKSLSTIVPSAFEIKSHHPTPS